MTLAERKKDLTGKFIGGDKLTDMQFDFVQAYVENGGHAREAAESAGYSQPRVDAYKILALPHVCRAIQFERERYINANLAGVALRTMESLMAEENSPQVRFQAAKWTLENAGHGLAAKQALMGLPPADKPLSEMTVDELAAFVEKGKTALENIKNVTPIEASAAPVA